MTSDVHPGHAAPADPSTPVPTSRADRYAYARARLAGARKGTAAVPAYLRYVNRPLGGRLACAAYAVQLSPSQVSMLSILTAATGLVLLAAAPATWAVGIVVAVLTALGYALDSADGQLARLRGGGTPAGEWLDHVLDIAKTCLLHSCVLIALYRNYPVNRAWLLVPLVFLLTQVTTFFSTMLRDALRQRNGLSRQPPSSHDSLRSALALTPFDHGTLCWLFVLLGAHLLFLGAYTALAAMNVLYAARALLRAHRTLGELTDRSMP